MGRVFGRLLSLVRKPKPEPSPMALGSSLNVDDHYRRQMLAMYSQVLGLNPGALVEPTVTPLPKRKSATPIRAWRQWRVIVRDEDYLLYSYNQSSVWEGPILRANGKPADHNPHQHATTEPHGIYAWPLISGPVTTAKVQEKRAKANADYSFGGSIWMVPYISTGSPFSVVRSELPNNGYAEGEVELIGKVVVHEKGYRAEAARVVSLFLRDVPTDAYRNGVLAKMEARYQCPVAIASDPDWATIDPPSEPEKPVLLPISQEDIAKYGHR